jgi:hypothetical protein
MSLIVIRIFCSTFKITLSTLLLNHTRIDIQNPDSASVGSAYDMVAGMDQVVGKEPTFPRETCAHGSGPQTTTHRLKVPHRPVITDAQCIILEERSFNSPVLHPNSPFEKQLQT